MFNTIPIVSRLSKTWNKLTRYQHHLSFLKNCRKHNVIPKGFQLKFNLALNTNNPELNLHCSRVLFNSSQELCNIVLKSTEEKVKHLQRELYNCRVNLFSQLHYFLAYRIWKSLEHENCILHNDLKAIEKRKMRKTIQLPAPPDYDNSRNTTHRKQTRRYDKSRRLQRKKEQFRTKHRSTSFAADDNKLQHLNPVNLSEHILSEDQTKLLRKGPSFCPAPRDINWQEVHDDLEAFEARLRTAVFFMEKDPEELAFPTSKARIIYHRYQVKKVGNLQFLNSRNLNSFYLTLGKTFLILETLETRRIIYPKGSAPRSGN